MGEGTESAGNTQETKLLKQVCQEVRRTGKITDELKNALDKGFEKRSGQALALVEGNKVRKYKFDPSGRIIWVVRGRKNEYQVVPESMFCTCDDFYFRVMGNKRQLCYHLIAQYLAEASGRYAEDKIVDSEYAGFTARWKPFGRGE